VAEADAAAVAKVVAEGFVVRKVAMGSNLVDVDMPRPMRCCPP
jgi:hypothetical protein